MNFGYPTSISMHVQKHNEHVFVQNLGFKFSSINNKYTSSFMPTLLQTFMIWTKHHDLCKRKTYLKQNYIHKTVCFILWSCKWSILLFQIHINIFFVIYFNYIDSTFGWTSTYTSKGHNRNPKIDLNYFYTFQISHTKTTKSGSLNPNLTYFGLNMVAERLRPNVHSHLVLGTLVLSPFSPY